MKPVKNDMGRAYVLFILAVVIASGVLVKLALIQWTEGEAWEARAQEFVTAYRDIEAIRGNILADDGSLLATSLPLYEIRMDMAADGLDDEVFRNGVDSLAYHLALLFNDERGEPEEIYRNRLLDGRRDGKRYLLVQDDVKYHEVQKAKEFPIFRKGRFKGGVIFEKRSERIYPFGILANRTIGYDKDKQVGLEGSYAEQLRGMDGKRLERRLVGGQWMPVNDGNDIEPKDGQDVVTSIDVRLQDVAETALLRQLEANQADHGCAVLMEVETGYIKAIANLGYDAQRDRYIEKYNYAVGEAMEPGSTFKLPALLAALEEGVLDVTDSVDTRKGVQKYYGMSMRDSNDKGYGQVTVQRAFELSSNVGISSVIYEGFQEDPQRFVDRIHMMGLGQPLGLDIQGEGAPKIKSTQDKDWWGTTLPWMSIGYETMLTPLQVLAFYNAVANDGKLVRPQFVTGIREQGEWAWQAQPIVLNPSIASRQNIEKCKRMLEGVVEDGTAKNLRDPDYAIAGKTGTAQIFDGENKTYGDEGSRKYLASFVGYFPADDPQYSCIVQVTAPSRHVYYGNLVAGPVFKEISDKVFARRFDLQANPPLFAENDLTRIPVSKDGSAHALQRVFTELGVVMISDEEQGDWVRTHTKEDRVDTDNQTIPEERVPNVKGMGLADALFILEKQGLVVQTEGRGIVKEQSLPPGTHIGPDTQISIRLEL